MNKLKAIDESFRFKSSRKKETESIMPEEYIRKNFTEEGLKLDIRPVYGNRYRLNYWGKKTMSPEKGEDNYIVKSLFIAVNENKDGCSYRIFE